MKLLKSITGLFKNKNKSAYPPDFVPVYNPDDENWQYLMGISQCLPEEEYTGKDYQDITRRLGKDS